MSPTDKLNVTLDAQTWEVVMRMLSEGPYRVVAPVITEIQRQCMEQASSKPEMSSALNTKETK